MLAIHGYISSEFLALVRGRSSVWMTDRGNRLLTVRASPWMTENALATFVVIPDDCSINNSIRDGQIVGQISIYVLPGHLRLPDGQTDDVERTRQLLADLGLCGEEQTILDSVLRAPEIRPTLADRISSAVQTVLEEGE